jgi:NADH-ubiquinone oxidoreductase chain 3
MSSMTFFFLFVSIIALLFLVINLLLAPHNPYQEKYSIFECGFHSFLGQNRTQFGVKFFIFALVYLLLDLEILLTFPFALSEYVNDIYGLSIALIFIIVITIGFVFELGKSALKIDSRQVVTLFNVKSSSVTELIAETETTTKASSVTEVNTKKDPILETESPKDPFKNLYSFDIYNKQICSALYHYLNNIRRELDKEISLRNTLNISTSSPEFLKNERENFIKEMKKLLFNNLSVLEDIDLAFSNNISFSLLENLNLEEKTLEELVTLKNNIRINLDKIEAEVLKDAF